VSRFDHLADPGAIVDRCALADRLAALPEGDAPSLRRAAVAELRAALDAGWAEIARRLAEQPSRGLDATNAGALLIDVVVEALFAFTTTRLHPLHNPTAGERLAILAVGGYGRGEMAPRSDVDIAFLTPARQTSWGEQVIESMLYALWDLGLKVGHSSRSLDDMVRQAKADVTVRTALLEARRVAGDGDLAAEAFRRFKAEVQRGTERQFIADKLAEREARHRKMGDTRYVVEPNVKEGKGGLRDLQALFWIGKYVYDVQLAAQLVDAGLFTRAEYRRFHRADSFFQAVRCHLHLATGRAEDRLTFDVQREIAERMRFADRPGRSAVERFMQYYFLQAKAVGDLTGVFLAHLEEQFAARAGGPGCPRFAAARAGSTASASIAGGSPSRAILFLPRIRCGWSRCTRWPTARGWRSTPSPPARRPATPSSSPTTATTRAPMPCSSTCSPARAIPSWCSAG
jgi:[protein-PII] uridylyltransferase